METMQSISNLPTASDFFANDILYKRLTIKQLDDFFSAKSMTNLILQCYGSLKTEKSQILLKLAEDFLYNSGRQGPCVRWQLEYDGSKGDFKMQLKSLTKQMYDCQLLNDEMYQKLMKTNEDTLAEAHAVALCTSKAHVALVIDFSTEQPNEENLTYLKIFLKKISEEAEKTKEDRRLKIHLYIATQDKSSIFSDHEYSKIKCFQPICMDNFQKNVSVEFLLHEDKSTVSMIHDKFNGCVTKLHFAKSYCRSKSLNYNTYWELIQNEDPKKAFSMYFRDDEILYKVLSCVSFLHHKNIPRFALERVFQHFSSKQPDFEEIIKKFLNLQMCSLNDEEDITFNKEVLQAIQEDQYSSSELNSFCPIQEIASIFAGLITKDLRQKKIYNNMLKLIPHGKALLKNIKERSKLLKSSDRLVLHLTISHLYETFGVIFFNDPSSSHDLCENYFTKALQIIWKDEKLSLLNPDDSEMSITDIAQTVVKTCKEAGEELPAGTITRYEANVLNLSDKKEIEFLEDKIMTDKQKVDQFHKTRKSSNYKFIEKLREWKLFLSEQEHRQIFFIERVASILHSWSRVILYKDSPGEDECDLYRWRSDVAKKLCKFCRNWYNVHLLTGDIIATSGVVPITLKAKPSVIEDLCTAKKLCESALRNKKSPADDAMRYEHGLVKEVYDSTKPKKKLSLLGSIVRINSRLPVPATHKEKSKYEKCCADLLKLASENLGDLSNAWMWFIYSAKYYASRRKFNEAVSCYEDYFEARSYSKIPHKGHSWAIYNYARTVHVGNLQEQITRATEKCKEVQKPNEDSTIDLTAKIKDILEKLKNM